MKIIKKSEEELLQELQALHEENESLKALYEKDMAEHKLAVEALNISEIRYRRLFETAKDGILILDADTGRIVDVNPFLIELLGYTKEDFIEKAIWEIGFFNDIVANQDKFLELKQKEYVRYEDLPLQTAYGRQINVEFVSNVYLVDTKKVIQCNIRDITERKKSEEKLKLILKELQHSNKELEQFAYVASHDLQEPLRMVSSFTQLLEKKYKDKLDIDALEYIKYAVDGANRMQLLINDLLEFSRISSRRKPLVLVDCTSVLGIVRKNLLSHIEDSNALISNDDLPIVMADESQLIRLFQNLIDNAIKFHGTEHPRIYVSAIDLGNEWQFSFKDNGVGIEEEFKDRIFVIFQRLHNREEYPGTGIGLAVCKRIVERHGGKIWFDSVKNIGTNFYFTIPKKEKK